MSNIGCSWRTEKNNHSIAGPSSIFNTIKHELKDPKGPDNIIDLHYDHHLPQLELPCPIKIGLGCVCGVELCMKLQHSVSRKCVRKIVLYHL